jgi:two-component sensor histidine kinase
MILLGVFKKELDEKSNSLNPVSSIPRSLYMVKSREAAEEKIKALEASLNEKVSLLKEVYHRVKNNFQVIISLINLQIESINNPLAKKILIESITRIKAMVLVHEMLYQSANLAEIEMKAYINDLLCFPIDAYGINEEHIKLAVDIDSISLPVDDAILCGLIINELITNAIKYAFPNGIKGQITVSLKSLEQKVTISVSDNGVGLADSFDIGSNKTLGMRLIINLAKQLRGDVVVKNDHGACFTINFMRTIK